MLNYCPKCGEKVVNEAAFCVRCGLHLLEIIGAPEKAGTAKAAKPIPTVKKRDLFGLLRFLRRSPKSESASTQPQTPKTLERPAIFYGILSVVVIGIVSAVMIPIAAGDTPRGQELGGAAFLAAICTYLILRRRDKSKTYASLFAALAFLVTAPLIGLLDGVVNLDRYALNREFSNNPAIAAMKDSDRKAYDEFLMRILRISRDTKDDMARGKIIVAAELASLYRRYARRTTDAALINLYGAIIRRMNSLRTTDPERCYRYGLGQYTPSKSKEVASEDNRESAEMMAAVIRAGINQPERPVHQARSQESIDKAYAVAELRLGAEAHLLNLLDDPKANFTGACKGMIALMQSILDLPPGESANVLRSFAVQ